MAHRVGWLAVLALAACSPDMGATAPWIPIDEIDGVLAPTAGETPDPWVAGTTLQVITYNVLYADAMPTIVEGLIAAGHDQADVILVQEIDSFPDEVRPRAEELAEALGMGFVYAPAWEKGTGTEGTAILSHHTLLDPRVMSLPSPGAYPVPTPRNALAAEIDTPSGPVTVISVHLDTRLSSAERVLQLRPVVIDAPTTTIVGGDMNTNAYAWLFASIPDVPADVAAATDQGPVLDSYVRSLGYATPTADVGATERLSGISSRLDAIYTRGVTPGAASVDRGVVGSDHWPVILDVTLD